MTDTVHQWTRRWLADGEPTPLADAHLESCASCRSWHHNLEVTLRSADSVFEPDVDTDDAFIERVIAARHAGQRRTTHRRALSAVAVVALLAGGGWIGSSLLAGDSTRDVDRLAAVADTWQASDGIRFVYSAHATVTPPFNATPTDTAALLAPLPTCATDSNPPTGGSPGPGGIDLSDAIDTLFGNDPCAALALIRKQIGGTAEQTATALYKTRTAAQSHADQVALLTAESPLEQLSLIYLRATAITQRDQADNQLAILRDAATNTARTLQPVADAAANGLPVEPLQHAVDDDLRALVAIFDNTATSSVVEPSATWEQLATGTWQRESIIVDGTTTAPDGTSLTFDTPSDDELDLVSMLFEANGRIIGILDSAPAAPHATITWNPPAAALDYPGINSWRATATLDADRLDELTLVGTGPTGVTITITITPER